MRPVSIIFLLLITFLGCKPDPCAEVACENGGTCMEGSCECPEGFSGDHCELFDYSQYLGTYQVAYGGCFSTSPNHTVAIEQVSSDSREVYLYRLGDYACPAGELRLTGSLSGQQLSLPEQSVDCGGIVYTFRGEGALVGGGQLSLSFTVQYEVDGFAREDVCQAMLDK
ncbi:MAG: hypothetical protein D6722_05130 [Bacteroidetes bacterium]|nr:MAG: hypothetical protein D6722_05130 [Bacteroidota bacterium]